MKALQRTWVPPNPLSMPRPTWPVLIVCDRARRRAPFDTTGHPIMKTQPLILSKDQERRLLAGHCWIYSNEVDTKATPLKDLQPGQPVAIRSDHDRWIGHGYANPHSLICARVVSRDPTTAAESRALAEAHPRRLGAARAALPAPLLSADLRRERRDARSDRRPLRRSARRADHDRRHGAGARARSWPRSSRCCAPRRSCCATTPRCARSRV
jgi:hypothetical protein